jgi:hypothetical protein
MRFRESQMVPAYVEKKSSQALIQSKSFGGQSWATVNTNGSGTSGSGEVLHGDPKCGSCGKTFTPEEVVEMTTTTSPNRRWRGLFPESVEQELREAIKIFGEPVLVGSVAAWGLYYALNAQVYYWWVALIAIPVDSEPSSRRAEKYGLEMHLKLRCPRK